MVVFVHGVIETEEWWSGPARARAGDPRHRVVAVPREAALELPKHVGLGGHDEVARLREAGDVLNHALGAADEVAVLADVLRCVGVQVRCIRDLGVHGVTHDSTSLTLGSVARESTLCLWFAR